MSKLKSLFKRAFNSNTPSNEPPALRFPAQIADVDCVPELIGKGTFGSVYKVTKDGKAAAVKVIECPSDYELELAKKECRMMEAVASDPYTVDYWDSLITETDSGHTVYILQEYLTSFEAYYNADKMTESEIVQLGIDICQAMIACRNAGFYHLDIQPKNLFVTEDGHFKLGDFGSATYLTDLTKPQPLRGTLAYMAPEVYESRLYSEQSELYSLSILLYTLLNRGIFPFADQMNKEEAIQTRLNGTRVPLLSIDSKALSRVLNLVCSPTPRMRFDSFEELLLPLKRASKEELPAPKPVPSTTFTYDNIDYGAAPPSFAIQHPSNNFDFDDVGSVCPFPQIFDADSFACTCALDVPLQIFDADSFACTCALEAPPQLFDADSFACTCAIIPPTVDKPPVPDMKQVQFSAIAPKTAVKGDYALVQLYMYEEAFRSVVDEAIAEAETEMTRKNSGIVKVGDNTTVKVVLTSPDVEIEDNENEQVWYGDYLVFDFAFEVPLELKKKQILLKAAVYFNDLPATKLMLTMKIQADQNAVLELQRNDIRRAYMSYAREDQSRVGSLVQGMRRVRPDLDIFFDVFALRCGENWEQALYQNLENSDTLFLCWSRSAKNSEWVEREWRYMLTNKGADSIEPLPIEPPELCPPPKELSMKYFNDNLLYMIDRKTD